MKQPPVLVCCQQLLEGYMSNILERILKGIEHPRRIPPYLLRKLFPEFAARHGISTSVVDIREEFITWQLGGFVQGAKSRPEFSARLYYDVSALRELLEEFRPARTDRALEVGCGYGRLTPWIDDFVRKTDAVDPNETVIESAKKQYPQINFRTERAQELPYSGDSFDLLVTWTVLQSIPPDVIHEVTEEMMRVLAPGGVLLLAEQVEKPDREITWSRSESEYRQLFGPLKLLESRRRPVEPSFEPEYTSGAVFDERTGKAAHPVERLLLFSDNRTPLNGRGQSQ